MTQSKMSCPKCNGEMDQGFVIDNTYGAALVSQWMKGPPKAAKFFGKVLATIVKTPKPADLIPIGTFRCSACGFLESYARPEFAAK